MPRHKKTRPSTDPTPERLATLGLADASPAQALSKLAPTWGENPEIETWAVRHAGAADDEGLGSMLHDLSLRTTRKDVRREIKRALYLLERRGLWRAPETPTPPKARDLLGPSEDHALGWISPIDATGTRVVWLARATGGAMASLSAILSEDRGIVELHSGKTTRKALREAQREISHQSGIRLVEAPWDWVHHLVRSAFDRTERGRFPEAPRLLKVIAPEPPVGEPTPPVDRLVDRAAASADEVALAASAELLTEPEMGPWPLPLPWLEDSLSKIAAAEESVLVVSPAAKEERLREAVDDAVARILDADDRRARFAARLEETAYLLAKRGAHGRAVSALAASIAATSRRPISEIPVLAEITRMSLALALREQAAKKAEREGSSLVVTPAQALAEQQRSARRRR